MIEDLLPKDLFDKYAKARDLILGADFLRLIVHYDGDGTSSAIILTNMLKRLNKKFHLSYIKELNESGFKSLITDDPTIVADAGSDQLRFIPDKENVVVLDHHFYTKDNWKGININARDHGIDGTHEACGSTMSYIMALVIDEKNADLFPFFMSGLIADKQDLGGISGLNLKLVESYGARFRKDHTLNLEGSTLKDSLTYSTDPFFRNITGFPDSAESFLKSIGVDPEKRPQDLSEDEKRLLANALGLKLLEQKAGYEALSYIEGDLYYFDVGYSSKQLSSIIDGNGKMGKNSVPVAYFLGYQDFKQEMETNWKLFKTKIIDYTYRSLGEMFTTAHISYFYAPESEMAGAISGIVMLYLADQSKPVIGFSVGKDETKVSSRGTRKLVSRGLNLSIVMREASAAVGGSGGGHDIAAGAVIPKGKEIQFLEAAEKVVESQIGRLTVKAR
ncbi:DHH family phosphoesterase [Thermoplasma sp.]|uniref:DHH family phosphoesterase n=1 Tax=Thermoplasma sp. TaxID=1973142 RepID=UPI00128453AD|nr:DHH family phosphoesterase [Thermoplasma sp.]KAA8922289.1 MAG: DHH family phosphoesterase [Thermoplasma sp.]